MKLNWEYISGTAYVDTPFGEFCVFDLGNRWEILTRNESPHFMNWITNKTNAGKLSKFWRIADTEKDGTDLCQNLISEYSNLIRELIS